MKAATPYLIQFGVVVVAVLAATWIAKKLKM